MEYPNPESQSATLAARARHVLPDGNSRTTIALKPYPIYIESAAGAEVIDVDGNHYIDFNNNYTSLLHGHCFEPVTRAVESQLTKATACSFTTVAEIELAELLCDRVESFEKIRFCNSGSEAVMNMLKAARAFTGRPKVAKIEGLYHGSYDFAEVSLKNRPEDRKGLVPRSTPYSFGTPDSVLHEVIPLPFNEAEVTEAIVEQHADSLACIMIDLMPQTLSMSSPSAEYLSTLARLANQYNILLAFDEVISFRLGYSGGQGMFGLKPDITSLGKIIGGGFPVGAIAGRADIMSVFEPGADGIARLPHGGTFNGNPITMAAGKAAMSAMDVEKFNQLNALGDQLREETASTLADLNMPGQVIGKGSLFAVRFHDRPMDNFADILVRDDERVFMEHLRNYLIGNGIWIGSNMAGCLSTATTEDHIDKFCKTLSAGIEACKESFPAN
ncbi:MAG: aspartate aminotransferase family protein [Gammaproteobacteria bacterium]|nr:aspartate aminotransferase family protein [Gammaproteobacteria bacterium]MDD9894796.1 aspartate aminotransferase family protein [Gammaproteobacteria bacterium]MDD9958281.1 aspartate aminotransferase family protein [Gammaproteobacteria bacterium]